MPGSHTAANLATEFQAMLDHWEINHERVHVVLRDNARNMAKALDDANLKSLPCLAHTLQLVVNEGQLAQRSIADVVATGRKLIGHFKHSPLAYSRLYDIQAQLNQPKKRLQQDVSTRWNSTVYMLQSLLEQRRAICVYAAENDLPATLTAHQWELMDNVLTILAPFEELTKEISSSTATAADVIPAITALKRLLEKPASTDRGVGTAKATLLEAVVRRFNNIEQEPLYSLATVLDPRYKNRYFSAEVKDEVKLLLLAKLEKLQPRCTAVDEKPVAGTSTGLETGDSDAPSGKRCSLLFEVHNEILKENTEKEQQLANQSALQVQSYLSEVPIDRSQDPLAYWKLNKNRFPHLALLAQVYLSAPWTSIESERLFSLAGHVVDEKRSRMSGDKAEKLLFIKKNLPLMNK
nr:zinc finger BED domain-containing protein 4-like [Paramormyrops kingsleyae]